MAILKQAFFWPFTFTDGGGFGTFDDVGQVYIGNGPFLSPYAFALAIKQALDAAFSFVTGQTFTVTYSLTTYRMTIASTAPFAFQFDSGDLQAAAVTGFADASVSGFSTYTADYSRLFNLWTPDSAVARDPGGSLYEEPDTQVNLAVGGRGKTWFEARLSVRPVRFEFLYPYEVFNARATSQDQTALEFLWLYGRSRVRYWTDRSKLFTLGDGLAGDFFLDQETVSKFIPERMPFQKELYSFDLGLRAYV